MRIISKSRLREFWAEHPDAEGELRIWHDLTVLASWKNPAEVKRVFGHRVDFVKVASGNTLAVFDVVNNRYRMVAAIHYDYPRVFVLRLMTHEEYDEERWKAEL
jgi:mRNA interferase HigB